MKFKHILTELKVIAAALVLASILGLITGYWGLSFAAALFLVLAWFLFQVADLREWLESGSQVQSAPNLLGAPDQIVRSVCNIKKDNDRQQKVFLESIGRFEAATAAMPDAMLIINSQQTIEWANPAVGSILGISKDKDLGKRMSNIIRNPVVSEYLSGSDYSRPLEFSSSNSEDNDLIMRVIPYGDEGHKLLCVSDHRDLLRLQKMRKSFISNASHEMRTPLTVIIGYLEAIILHDEASPATRKGIDGALEQAHRLKHLIEDLLSLSRLESLPLSKMIFEDIKIGSLVEECVELVKSSDIYNRQVFEVNMDPNAMIRGDQRELKSAIQNVIDNAVKYSPAGSQISIEWRHRAASTSVLSISDQGEGVEEAKLTRLTERFYRVDKGRSRDMGGTGLGLSIVKHVMERHGGALVINSEVGIGTTVELHFSKSD